MIPAAQLAAVTVTDEARALAGRLLDQARREHAAVIYRTARGALDTQEFDAVRAFAGDPAPPRYRAGRRTVAVDLSGAQAEIRQPAAARSPFLADWRRLPLFRATCRIAGWCGLAMRRGAPDRDTVPPAPWPPRGTGGAA